MILPWWGELPYKNDEGARQKFLKNPQGIRFKEEFYVFVYPCIIFCISSVHK